MNNRPDISNNRAKENEGSFGLGRKSLGSDTYNETRFRLYTILGSLCMSFFKRTFKRTFKNVLSNVLSNVLFILQ